MHAQSYLLMRGSGWAHLHGTADIVTADHQQEGTLGHLIIKSGVRACQAARYPIPAAALSTLLRYGSASHQMPKMTVLIIAMSYLRGV